MSQNPSSAVDRENPWPGLAAFTEDLRGFFFGRDKETEELVRLVRRQTLTVLFGQSGLGKSSLLQAGVFPRLRDADFLPLYLRLDHGFEVARAFQPVSAEITGWKARATLADQVKAALTAAIKDAGAEAPVPRADESLWEYFHRKDIDIWSAKNRLLTPVLAFDQFEEIFTLGRADDTRRARGTAFLSELADLVENRAPAALREKFDAGELDPTRYNFDKPSCQVVLTLREDFLPDLEGLKNEMRSILTNRMRIRRLTGTQALEIVQKPAPHLLAEGVAERVVEFVAGVRGGSAERLLEMEVEPALLSVICRELNERRRALGQAQITADLVSGNRREILTDFYERSVADLPAAMRAFVEDHLLTKSGFRDNLALETALESPGVNRPLIDTLVSRRLLRIEDRLGVQRVELTHDVLAEVIRTSRDARQASEAIKTEERRRREAEEALARSEAEKAAARRSLWRARLMLGVCAILALAALYGFWEAHRAQTRAERLAAIADQSRVNAVAARAVTDQAREQAEGVLGFNLIELGEQLSAYGHLPLMLQVAEKAVAYYEGLPRGLDSPAIRASYARALDILAWVLVAQGEWNRSQAPRNQALQIFEELERANALTPAMRVDYGSALSSCAMDLSDRLLPLKALPFTERAEAVLRPVLADAQQGGLAQRQLVSALWVRGYCLRMVGGRSREAVTVLQQAMANADEADRRPPLPRRPGLRAAGDAWLLSEMLADTTVNRRTEALEINEKARAVLRAMLEREPFLFAAKRALGVADYNATDYALADWESARFHETIREYQQIYEEMLRLDPKNGDYLERYGISWTIHRFTYDVRHGDFVAAEADLRKGLPYLTSDSASPFVLQSATSAEFGLARVLAATGRNAAADEALVRAESLAERSNPERSAGSTAFVLNKTGWSLSRRAVESARLNWAAVRNNAEDTLATLAQLRVDSPADQTTFNNQRNAANRDLMTAAFAQGDYAAARRALASAGIRSDVAPRDTDTMQARFDNVGRQLQKVHVLHRAGESDEARKVLAALWPEVEAVFAKAPDELFNQVRLAWALWIKSEVAAGLDPAGRRALLESAASYLRPAAVAGKLTRYEREVLLAEIEAALAGRPVFVPTRPAGR